MASAWARLAADIGEVNATVILEKELGAWDTTQGYRGRIASKSTICAYELKVLVADVVTRSMYY